MDRLDVSGAEEPADGPSGYIDGYLSQSADGRHVLFSSLATNLAPGDTNAGTPISLAGLDLFVRDRMPTCTGAT